MGYAQKVDHQQPDERCSTWHQTSFGTQPSVFYRASRQDRPRRPQPAGCDQNTYTYSRLWGPAPLRGHGLLHPRYYPGRWPLVLGYSDEASLAGDPAQKWWEGSH